MRNVKKGIVALLVLLLVSGCSSGKSDSGNGSTADPSAKTDKNKVVVATDTDLSSMDLHVATDGTSFEAATLGFAGLTELDKNNQPIPDLAKSWEVNEEGTVYTFHLVDSKWSNGQEVTADDFVYGWRRILTAEVASEYGFIMSVVGLKNADAVKNGEVAPEELGIKAIDSKTLEVTLDQPCDFFLGLLAFPSFFPLNQEFVEAQGNQYATTPDKMIYSGPYVMTAWTPGSGYSFKKNPEYFQADKIDMEEIEFKFIQDSQTAMLEYQSGNIDVVKLSGEMVDAYKTDQGFTNRLQGYLWFLSLNFEVAELDNLNLRKAIGHAVDRETIAEFVLKDGSIAAEGIIPVLLATGPDGKDFRETAGKVVEYNPEKAAEYYEAAKGELGKDVTLELLYEDTEASKAVAEYIQNNLEENCPGLSVQLNSKPKKARLQLQREGDYQLALHRWGPDYADPQTYLELFLTGAVNNYGKYEGTEYDSLVNEGISGESSVDSQKRWELFLEAEKVLLEQDAAVVPIYQNGGAMMINPEIEGIEFHSAGVDNYRHIKQK